MEPVGRDSAVGADEQMGSAAVADFDGDLHIADAPAPPGGDVVGAGAVAGEFASEGEADPPEASDEGAAVEGGAAVAEGAGKIKRVFGVTLRVPGKEVSKEQLEVGGHQGVGVDAAFGASDFQRLPRAGEVIGDEMARPAGGGVQAEAEGFFGADAGKGFEQVLPANGLGPVLDAGEKGPGDVVDLGGVGGHEFAAVFGILGIVVFSAAVDEGVVADELAADGPGEGAVEGAEFGVDGAMAGAAAVDALKAPVAILIAGGEGDAIHLDSIPEAEEGEALVFDGGEVAGGALAAAAIWAVVFEVFAEDLAGGDELRLGVGGEAGAGFAFGVGHLIVSEDLARGFFVRGAEGAPGAPPVDDGAAVESP